MPDDEPATAGTGRSVPEPPGRRTGPAPRRWPVAVVVLLVATLCATVSGWAVRRHAWPPTGADTTGAGAVSARPLRAGAPPDARHAAVTAALQRQARALLAGRRAGFLAVGDPGAAGVGSWLAARFGTLRDMGITRWTPALLGLARTDATDSRWAGTVRVRYCLGDPACAPSTIDLDTVWKLTDPRRPRLVRIGVHPPDRSPPWEHDRLRATVGARTVVATTAGNAALLPSTAAAAEAAARVADRFALDRRPGRYVVYLAGGREWKRWSPPDIQGWVAGYATERDASVVVRISALASTDLSELLRHELGHVATLGGRARPGTDARTWWLVEGLAEYVTMHGQPASAYPNATLTARFVRRGWDGTLALGPPARQASRAEVAGRYGLAYLGVSCLAQRYGRARMLRFFHAVAVAGEPVDRAAEVTLRASWPAVSRRCAARIRDTIG